MRDHGGNLDWAMAQHGGAAEDWIDLSTGINPRPYPVSDIAPRAWSALPTRTDLDALAKAAQEAYETGWNLLPVAGAQAAIQMIPRMTAPGRARVLGPTYNEHAASLRSAGWEVAEVDTLAALRGAELAVVVNPNNPDGRRTGPGDLAELAAEVALLVVDESFCDVTPELTMLQGPQPGNILVMRSFGKFYGLAGVRLGFVLGARHLLDKVSESAGPWPVSGPAIAIGRAALADQAWAVEARIRLATDARRLDGLAAAAGWACIGGTDLFRTYDVPDAAAVQDHLAKSRIWSRRFPYSTRWQRLGLPDGARQWARLEAALAGQRQ